MADEKTNPTPKVEGARTDTMHSNPGTPDRSKLSAEELKQEREATAPPSNSGSVGSERPNQSVIKTENSGTLVTDIPALDEGEETVTNEPLSAPEAPVGTQPGESFDNDTRKPFDKRQAKAAPAKSSATKSRASTSKASSAKDKA